MRRKTHPVVARTLDTARRRPDGLVELDRPAGSMMQATATGPTLGEMADIIAADLDGPTTPADPPPMDPTAWPYRLLLVRTARSGALGPSSALAAAAATTRFWRVGVDR